VLFSVVLFIYFKMTFIAEEPDLVSEELQPVQRYIEDCIAKSAEDAVRIIGQQGGYINIPSEIDFNPSRYVNPDRMGLVKIPFWFYKGERTSPSQYTVEREIATYVEENAYRCFDDFEAFPQYKIVELGDFEVEVFLNLADVSLTANYPIKITYHANNTHSFLDKFSAKVDVRLSKILEMANELLDSEVGNAWLENFTIDLMASNLNVPFTDMKFTCQILQWNINDIREEVEDMLFYNLPRIRRRNTNYRPFMEKESQYKKLLEYHMEDIATGNFPKNVPEDAYEYLHMFWDTGIEEDDAITIGLKSVPGIIDLIGRPNDNGILRSNLAEGSKKYIPFLCVNIYHFVYDVNYPVIVTVRDDDSFNGKGYVFTFSMPVTIHNNEPYKIDYGYDMFTTTYFDRGFCDDTGEYLVDIRAYGNEEGYSNTELNNVNLSLQCFKYHCPLGMTGPDAGSYRLRTYLPGTCANPFIIAEKEGYLKAEKQLEGDRIELDLTRLKKLDYEVVFHRYNSIGDEIGSGKELDEDMQVSIQISTDDFYQYKVYPFDEGSDMDLRTVELVEGNADYNLEIVLTQGDEYVGGYNGEWKSSGIDVANSDKVVFHVLKYVPIPYTKEDKMEMMAYILAGNYKSALRPSLE